MSYGKLSFRVSSIAMLKSKKKLGLQILKTRIKVGMQWEKVGQMYE